ncbi:MAG: acyl transferase [Ichthyobacteriaceae bacterium]|nr:acyl transferase [Ichthyobacteriaceae bacterium]
MNIAEFKSKIFKINDSDKFKSIALDVFKYQAKHNLVYNQFINYLNIDVDKIQELNEIPFMPIEFFKSHEVVSGTDEIKEVFLSSGTTGMQQSKHFVSDTDIYEESYLKGFEYFYGNITDYVVLGLLPSYLERNGSSLIYMVDDLIKKSGHKESGFYLNDYDKLVENIIRLENRKQKILLVGVSFALLDLLDEYNLDLRYTTIMETGGMKGRRKEMVREELHEIFTQGFGVEMIHSEYGMTELLSQGYSKGNGIFNCPPWMKIMVRDTEDPFSYLSAGKSGGINVIDLANVNSCSFIATQDLGRVYANESFEVIGRFDNSDIRGCNLLVL